MKRGNQRSSLFMLRAFNEALGDSWKSTVRFIHGGEQVALGAIVDSEGWIVTKASQLPPSGEITCRMFDGRESIAAVVSRVHDHDLALVHIPETKLTAITWDSNSTPERGNWLATTDLRATPIAVGVISAGVQNILPKLPRLGVHLEETNGGGAVSMVLPGSGADEAGIRRGDTLYSVNGKELDNRQAVISAISQGRAGEFIRIGVDRAEKRFEVDARLMDLTDELLDKTEMEVNGRVSARSSDFKIVFSHDTVLEPQECGGPLVNLDGKVVGINIARAGRVTSYAIPAQTVKPLVDSMLAQARLVSTPSQPVQSTLRPIR
jgi:serine protease Do